MIQLDKKLDKLPLTKSNPKTLNALFGRSDIQPMWVADMEFELAKPIQDALITRISGSGFGYEYKPESFYSAQKHWYKNRYNIQLNLDHILYSPSISTSITALIEEYTNLLDGIIIQPPVYSEFRAIIRQTNRKIVKNPLKLVNYNYQIDFDDLERKAKDKNNKILILCNPHNPVGRVWTKAELNRIVDICKANDTLIISDEIHKDIVLFDHKFTSILHYLPSYDKIVACTSEAKSFNLCGIADSMAIIPNTKLRNQVSNVFKKYNLGRTNALTRVALETAYQFGEPWLKDVKSQIENNVLTIEKALQNSAIKLIKPQGTYQVWLDFREVFSDSELMFKTLTATSGIGLNPGHWYGKEGALFTRMNIATSSNKIIYAIEQLIKTEEQHIDNQQP